MMEFARKLARIRKDRAISQEALAERVGVSRQSVAKWESGESLPDIERLVLLSALFAVSIDSLVKDDDACVPASESRLPAPGPLVASGSPSLEDAVSFLIRAKRATYAGHGAEVPASRDASRDLSYREGDLLYYDTYLGGERFAGEEALWDGVVPFWAMNYAGRALDERFSGDFLKESLSLVPLDIPYRGPRFHRNGEYSYHCMVRGDFGWFEGNEEIYVGADLAYECRFHGGAVR